MANARSRILNLHQLVAITNTLHTGNVFISLLRTLNIRDLSALSIFIQYPYNEEDHLHSRDSHLTQQIVDCVDSKIEQLLSIIWEKGEQFWIHFLYNL